MVLKSKTIYGKPVISLEDGQTLGKAHSLVVDHRKLVVAAVALERKGLLKDGRVIPYEQVQSIGQHAIIINKTTSIHRVQALPHIAHLLRQGSQLIGAKVITEEGLFLGKVEEFSFAADNGKVVTLELSENAWESIFKGPANLNSQHVITVGETIIVKAGAETRLEYLDSSWQETIKLIKETGAKVWSSTIETAKKWSQSVSSSIERLAAEADDDSQVRNMEKANQTGGPQSNNNEKDY